MVLNLLNFLTAYFTIKNDFNEDTEKGKCLNFSRERRNSLRAFRKVMVYGKKT